MRIAVLADVHANRPALVSVLRDVDEHDTDALVVAGDLVGYGPHPDACVAMLAERGAIGVAGNHDLRVLDRLPPAGFSPIALRSLERTAANLGADTRAFLDALPLARTIAGLALAHGSPDDPQEYVTDPDRGRQILADLPRRAPDTWLQVLGHTHLPWLVTVAEAPGTLGTALVNPGAVGQSRLRERRPLARYVVVDDVTREIEFRAVAYDRRTTKVDLRRLGLPSSCVHCPPRRLRRLRRVARRGIDALTGIA
ncbi:MAG TPA: metallophosphoesterase family protein [Egicoccus sp.]|nr:metallophosphoesterase family protein [Egicoccus sp.]HSK22578.1 metallophosphoesterase family protein [Egicoccus sp.]